MAANPFINIGKTAPGQIGNPFSSIGKGVPKNNLKNPKQIDEPGFKEKAIRVGLKGLDILNTASYAVGGIIEGVGAKEGIKQKIFPSKALGIKNPVLAFTVDVLTDPTTYLTLGAGAGVKGAVTVGGRVLSKKGVIQLRKTSGNLKINKAKQLGVVVSKLPATALKEVDDAARLSLAKKLKPGSELLERAGAAFAGQRVVTLPKVVSKRLEKFGEIVAQTKGAQVLGKVFQGEKFAIRTDKTLNFAQKEAALQGLEKLRISSRLAKAEAVETTKNIIKKFGTKAFNKVRDFIEGVPNAAALQVIKTASKKVDDAVKAGKVSVEDAVKIKGAIKDSVKALKKEEAKLLKAGILKAPTKEIAFFPREVIKERAVVGVSAKLLRKPEVKARVLRKIITKEGQKLIVKVTERGKKAIVVGGERFGKRGLQKGQVLKFISKANVKKQIESITTKLNQQLKLVDRVIKKSVDPKIIAKQKKIREDLIKRAEKKKEDILRLTRGGDRFVRKGEAFKVSEVAAREIEIKTAIRFEPEAASPFVKSLLKSKNALIHDSFIKQIQNNLGKLDGMGSKTIGREGVSPGFVRFDSISKIPGMQNVQIPATVADALKGNFNIASNDGIMSKVLQKFDNVQNWWKAFALVGLAYHTRNMVGNIWNNFLGGVTNPNSYIKAGRLQRGGNLTKAEKIIIEKAREHGVVQTGFYGGEIVESIGKAVRTTSVNPLSRQGFLVRGSQFAGEVLENNARIAHFIDRLGKGDSFNEASSSVKKFLFDYTDLSQIEQRVFKRIVPFYTWSRKNIPLQLEQIVKQPGKAAGLEKFFHHIQPDDAEEVKENLPDWLKRGHPIVLPWKDPKTGLPQVVNLEGILPVYDVTRLAHMGFKDILDMVTPLAKMPLEIGFNADFFRDFKKIEATKGRESLFKSLLDAPVTGDDPRSKFLYGIFNSTQAHIIKNAYRPLRDLDTLFQPGRTDKETASGWNRIIQAIIFKAQPIDVVQQKSFKQYLESKEQKELTKIHTSVAKKFLKFENKLDEKNMELIEKRMIELGISPEAIQKSKIQAIRQDLKFNQLDEIIKLARKENRAVTFAERRQIAEKLKETYKGKSLKRAMNAIDKIIKSKTSL